MILSVSSYFVAIQFVVILIVNVLLIAVLPLFKALVLRYAYTQLKLNFI
jgi:hypothetical protein